MRARRSRAATDSSLPNSDTAGTISERMAGASTAASPGGEALRRSPDRAERREYQKRRNAALGL
jgi:hypothetical protein